RFPLPPPSLRSRRRHSGRARGPALAHRGHLLRAPDRRVHGGPRRAVFPLAATEESLMLELRDVSFAYEGSQAVDRITASFDATQLIALTGPNGSGKSTLLKLIARVL